VDKLHASTEGHVEDPSEKCHCFFHKAFYGTLRSSVTCDRCGNVTRTEDPMVDLSLDVQVQAKKRALGGQGSSTTPTLTGCLESFTSPEKLMAGVYNCSGCGGTPQKATKQLRIKKLPAILCIQLKVCPFCTRFFLVTAPATNKTTSASNTLSPSRRRWRERSISPCPSTCFHTQPSHTPKLPSSRNTCTT